MQALYATLDREQAPEWDYIQSSELHLPALEDNPEWPTSDWISIDRVAQEAALEVLPSETLSSKDAPQLPDMGRPSDSRSEEDSAYHDAIRQAYVTALAVHQNYPLEAYSHQKPEVIVCRRARAPPDGRSSLGVAAVNSSGVVGSRNDCPVTLKWDSGADLTLISKAFLDSL